jgi:ABC-type transporter Mla MlaB component
MLRITHTARPDGATLVLEGRLAGPWVAELDRCWQAAASAHDGRAVRVELHDVTHIDAAGIALLRAMHVEGATLVASGCMTHAILEEIKQH